MKFRHWPREAVAHAYAISIILTYWNCEPSISGRPRFPPVGSKLSQFRSIGKCSTPGVNEPDLCHFGNPSSLRSGNPSSLRWSAALHWPATATARNGRRESRRASCNAQTIILENVVQGVRHPSGHHLVLNIASFLGAIGLFGIRCNVELLALCYAAQRTQSALQRRQFSLRVAGDERPALHWPATAKARNRAALDLDELGEVARRCPDVGTAARHFWRRRASGQWNCWQI